MPIAASYAKGSGRTSWFFDFASIQDRATYEQPRLPPEGIDWVIVNGQVVIERGKHTGARPGRVLYGPGGEIGRSHAPSRSSRSPALNLSGIPLMASHTYGMVFHMKTTLVIDDAVMARLKRESLRSGRTMSELVETALRRFLQSKPDAVVLSPLPSFASGGALVDVADREALYRAMEGR